MVHQKFLKINGKTYGPYYYESYREDGKVKKRYILHQESSLGKKIFLPLIIIIACLGIVFLLYSPLTGKSIQDKSQKVNIPEAESPDKSPNMGIPEAVPSAPNSKTPTIGIPETNEPSQEPALGSTQESENTTKQKIDYIAPENNTKLPNVNIQVDYSNCDFNLSDCKTSGFTDGKTYCLNTSVSSVGNCMGIDAHNVILDCKGFNLTGPGTAGGNNGITISSVNNVTVRNCTVSSYWIGIQETSSINSIIEDNILNYSTSCFAELYLNGGANNTVQRNQVYGNTTGQMIYLSSTNDNNILNNFCITQQACISLASSSQRNNITGNTINDSLSNGIEILSGSLNTSVIGNYLNNISGTGIVLQFMNNTLVMDNKIYLSGMGIYLYSSQYNIITSNTILNASSYGINIGFSSKSNNFSYNNIEYSGSHGIITSSDSTLNNFTGTYSCFNNPASGNFDVNDVDSNIWSNTTCDTKNGTTASCNSPCLIKCGSILASDTVLTENLVNSTGGTICPGGSGLIIGANDLTLDCAGFSMTGNNTGIGINISGFNNTQIKNCYIQDFAIGINISRSKDNQITNTTLFDNNNYGIYVYRSSNNSVTNCSFNSTSQISPDQTDGVFYFTSSNNTIINSIFDNQATHGVYVISTSANNTLSNNTFIDKGVYIGDAITSGSNYTRIENNTFSVTNPAININCLTASACNYNLINNNFIQSNDHIGISLSNAPNSVISNNLMNKSGVSGGDYGISIASAINTQVYQNIIQNTGDDGIYLTSDLTRIYNNTIQNTGGHGIYAYLADSNRIENNTITNIAATYSGIYLEPTSTNNTLYGNYINNTNYGIYVNNAPNSSVKSNIIYNASLGLILSGNTNPELNLIIDSSNMVNGKNISVLTNVQGQEINDWTDINMLLCYNCSNINISNVQLTANNSPVMFFKDSDTVIINNVSITGNGAVETTETPKDNGEFYFFNTQDIYMNNTLLMGSSLVGYGIFTINSSAIIENSYVQGFHEGIYLTVSSYNTIKNTTAFLNNDAGIYIYYTNNTVVESCLLNNTGTVQAYGVYISNGNNNSVISSVFDNQYTDSINLISTSNNNTIAGNTILDKGISMGSTDNNLLIENNTIITSSAIAIEFVCTTACNRPIIRNNFIETATSTGISLSKSPNSTIYNNFINKTTGASSHGILLNDALTTPVQIYNNTIQYPGGAGILLSGADNIRVENNTIKSATQVSYGGIHLASSAANNTFLGNIITNCSFGILISDAGSTNNTIYNNFFNNTINARDFSNNTWNMSYSCSASISNIIGGNCTGGNYWGGPRGYTGLDDGSGAYPHNASEDGIGDTNLPYNASNNISYGKGDFLPLVYITQADTVYPIFSNYYNNNESLVGSGFALFNVTVDNTNGTVILTINNTNYTARNLTANVYNVSIYMTQGVFDYYWQAYGNGTNMNYNASQTFSYTINATSANDTYSDFTGNTTDFNNYPDPSNVTNATLEVPGNGTIRWLVNVNATDQNFNINVNISYNTIYINTSGLNPSFNTSAELTLYNLVLAVPKIKVALDDSTFVICNATTDPVCNIISYSSGTLVFNVSHFTTYTALEGSVSCGDTITTDTTLASDLICNGTALNIGADNIVLDCDGYDIIGNRSGYGINLTGKNSFTVRDCTIKNFSYGIYMKNSDLTNVINNSLDNSTYGLYAESSNSLVFSNNTLINSGWQGINLTLSNNTLIDNNNISFNAREGLYAHGLNNSIIKNNYFSNNIFGGIDSEYSENTLITENNITNNPYIGIYVADSRNYNITKNQVFNNRWGIELFEFYDSTATYNNIINSSGSSSSSGFTCDWTCVNITVSHNIFNNNSGYGFDCENECFNSSIVNNTANYNNYGGLFIARSGNLTFIDNSANYNKGYLYKQGGFYIDTCQDIFLINNTIKNNNYAGIQMAYSVTSGQISSNTIINNGNGTDDTLKSGIYFYDVSNFKISSNNITNTSHSGIYLNTSNENIIENNTINKNRDGIHAEYSVNNTFVYNTIELSTNQGIYIFPSANNNISFNKVTNNNIAIAFEEMNNSIFEGNNASNNSIGIDCYSNCYSNTFKNNFLNRNSDAGWACDSICPNNVVINNTASNNGYTGFACYNECQNITLANNTGNNNGYNGFECDFNCSNSIIIGNSFNNNTHYGFEAYEMSTSMFISNAMQNNKGVGFYLDLGYNSSLINNEITKNINYGIWIEETENVTVLNNNLTLNYFGIFTAFGNYTNISNNDVSFSNDSGIYLEDCANNWVYNNTANYITEDVTLIGIVVYGLATECPGNQVIKNNASHNGNYGIMFDGCLQGNITENYAENNSQFGIYIFGSSNITASSNILLANLNEIQVEDSNYNRLENNILIQNDQYGIYLLNSAYNLLIQNNISDGSTGISAVDSQNNTFYKNQIINCINIGLDIHNNCHNSNASLNILNLNNYGLEIYNTNNSLVESNNITNSLTNGIYVYQSINNSIISNYIINTTLEGIYITSSSNNTIYNNFFNNTVNAIEFTAQDTNIWNTTYFCSPTTVNIIGHNCTGGNFWSDYTGADNTGDYIGDTKLPYNASNALWGDGDYLPLVSVTSVDKEYPKFSNFWDNNATLVLNGTALFNVTVSSTNGTVFLQINNTNYTATNLTANVYNVSVTDLINETYTYYWQAFGNGSNHYFNISNARSYTVLTTAPVIPVTPPSGGGGAGPSACTPIWSCDLAYSSCTNGLMTRNCTDLSNCKKSEKMPENCIYSPDSKCIQTLPCCISLTSVPENWSNCIDNIQSRNVKVYCDEVISSITQENYSCQFIEPQITYSPQASSISTYSTKPILFKVDVKSKSILAEPSLIHINWYIGSDIVKQEFGKLELSSEFSQGFTQDATLKAVIIEQGFRKEILWSVKKKEYPSSSTLIRYGEIAVGAAIAGYILLQLVKLLVRQARLIRLRKVLSPPSKL